jgi:hypothetical protein
VLAQERSTVEVHPWQIETFSNEDHNITLIPILDIRKKKCKTSRKYPKDMSKIPVYLIYNKTFDY